MSSIIQVEGLSKSFVISHIEKERYTALRDVMAKKARSLLSFGAAREEVTQEEFWALKDINFSINQGDRVGIIGRNGAGKSTLLKILSRITEPTKGRITIRGRIASLLEVGTGFHPELTGRENIYLNGAILGMTRSEISRKFDEIVAFSEVERFLDTPVKRYSSGMYVRLAFAVAAHLEPEILIVDEVLAVGDAQFQKKCLGKMEDISNSSGRTILFVSHNMNVVKTLCNTGILLSQGRISDVGSISGLVDKYLEGSSGAVQAYSHKTGGTSLRIHDVVINGSKQARAKVLSRLDVRVTFRTREYSGDAEFFVLIYNMEGICVQGLFQADANMFFHIGSESEQSVSVSLDNVLTPGKYFVSVGAFDRYRNFLDWVEYCESFEVEPQYEDGRVYLERLGSTVGTRVTWEKI